MEKRLLLKMLMNSQGIAERKEHSKKLDFRIKMNEARCAYEQMQEVQELLNQAYQDLINK